MAVLQSLLPGNSFFGGVPKDSSKYNESTRIATAVNATASQIYMYTGQFKDPMTYAYCGKIGTSVDYIGPAPIEGWWAHGSSTADPDIISTDAENFILFKVPLVIRTIVVHLVSDNPTGSIALVPIIETYTLENGWSTAPGNIMPNSDTTILTNGPTSAIWPRLTGYQLDKPLQENTEFRVRFSSTGLAGIDTASGTFFDMNVYYNMPAW